MDMILIVYNDHPEKIRVLLIPKKDLYYDDKEKWIEYFEMAHGKMVNNDDPNEGMNFFTAAMIPLNMKDNPYNFDPNTPEEWKCALIEYEVETKDISPKGMIEKFGYTAAITDVYYTGFYV